MTAQKPKILIVDDEPLNIDILSSSLAENYTLFAATSGEAGLKVAHNALPDLIILDVCMPNMNGYEFYEELRKDSSTKEIPVVFCTAQDGDSDEEIGLQMGAVDYIHKPFKPELAAIRIKNQLELHLYRKSLESAVEERTMHLKQLNDEIEQTLKETLFTLAEAAEIRSKETGYHIKRVAHYSYLLAKYCGLDEQECQNIKFASTMHDIGKLVIPDEILHKNGKLTSEEYVIMKNHSRHGEKILQNSNRELFKLSSVIAITHHEKFDGTGYPNNLAGQNIPIAGRIVAIADVFDALACDRCYKQAWPTETILEYFREETGKQFDPDLMKIFFDHLDEFLHIKESFKD